MAYILLFFLRFSGLFPLILGITLPPVYWGDTKIPVEALITFSETKPDYLSVEKITTNNENVVEVIIDKDALYYHYYYEQYYGDYAEDNQDNFDFWS